MHPLLQKLYLRFQRGNSRELLGASRSGREAGSLRGLRLRPQSTIFFGIEPGVYVETREKRGPSRLGNRATGANSRRRKASKLPAGSECRKDFKTTTLSRRQVLRS